MPLLKPLERFFIEGGAVAVEQNANKAAMDWKVRKIWRWRTRARTEILHFPEKAFHGPQRGYAR